MTKGVEGHSNDNRIEFLFIELSVRIKAMISETSSNKVLQTMAPSLK